MADYGPGCQPQNIIWTEAKRSGNRPFHKLPFGLKSHELFVTLYSIKPTSKCFVHLPQIIYTLPKDLYLLVGFDIQNLYML